MDMSSDILCVDSILGHEGVAEALVSHRENVQAGDKFTFAVADSCSNCEMCSRGLNQKCKKLFKVGNFVILRLL